jgi:hypothetical protein
VLEADLYRSEAKLAAIQKTASDQEPQVPKPEDTTSSTPSVPYVYYSTGKDGKVMLEQEDEVPKDKEEGFDRWKFEMTMRFLKGEDPDFEYRNVDENEELDVIERAEEEERWFEDEEPSWVNEKTGEGTGGETGILDY